MAIHDETLAADSKFISCDQLVLGIYAILLATTAEFIYFLCVLIFARARACVTLDGHCMDSSSHVSVDRFCDE